MPSFPQTAEVDPNDARSFELIPSGWYAAELVESEHKTAKSGNGEYLSLQFSILDAPFSNRRIFVAFNLWNANEEAVRIANQQRLELLEALGKPGAQTTEELYAIPVMLKIGVREDKSGKYEPQNVVKGFKALGGRPALTPGPSRFPAPAAPATRAAPAKKPWEK